MNFSQSLKCVGGTLALIFFAAFSFEYFILPILVNITIQSRFVDWMTVIKIAIFIPAFLAALALFVCAVIWKCRMILRMRP